MDVETALKAVWKLIQTSLLLPVGTHVGHCLKGGTWGMEPCCSLWEGHVGSVQEGWHLTGVTPRWAKSDHKGAAETKH